MKILQINAVYGMGSTGRMVRDISYKLMDEGHESYVMWATGCRQDSSNVNLTRIGSTLDHKMHALLRRIDGGQGMHSKRATKNACSKILEISPDVVHLHNLHSNYIHLPTLFKFLAKHNIPTLITMHDCWFVSGYCEHYIYHGCDKWLNGCTGCPAVGKRLRKKVAKGFALRKKLFQSVKFLAVNGVSQWTTEAAKKSVLKTASHIECIYNWVDTNVYKPTENTDEAKAKYPIASDKKLILGVSQSWSSEKGAEAFIKLAKELSDVADVILVGENNGVQESDNLHCIGFTSSVNELVDLYSSADILVNASKAETFGLVTVEAMACGTPVVAYNNSGSSEIVTNDCGRLVQDGNQEMLIEAVKDMLKFDKAEFSASCRNRVCQNFEKDKQVRCYIELYEKISSIDKNASSLYLDDNMKITTTSF